MCQLHVCRQLVALGLLLIQFVSEDIFFDFFVVFFLAFCFLLFEHQTVQGGNVLGHGVFCHPQVDALNSVRQNRTHLDHDRLWKFGDLGFGFCKVDLRGVCLELSHVLPFVKNCDF